MSTQSKELAKCPHCNSDKVEDTEFSTGPGEYALIIWCAYFCSRCGFTAASATLKDKAADNWNCAIGPYRSLAPQSEPGRVKVSELVEAAENCLRLAYRYKTTHASVPTECCDELRRTVDAYKAALPSPPKEPTADLLRLMREKDEDGAEGRNAE